MTTIVARSHRTIEGKLYHHGDEIPPGLLSDEAINRMLVNREVDEYNSADRRSLYRLFHRFSDCKETE
jgi:hypothetical protein